MQTVKARFDGHVFVPEQPVNLPVGFVVELPLTGLASDATPPAKTFADLYGIWQGLYDVTEEDMEAALYRQPKWDGVSDIE